MPLVTPPFPSETAYVMTGTVPKYPALGVNVKLPFAFTMIEPTPAISTIVPAAYVTDVFVPTPATENCVIVKDAVPVSTSVSLVNKLIEVIAVFSNVVGVSFATTGRSFTGVTEIFTLAVAVAVPSETVYVMAGTTPLKLATGVNVNSPVGNTLTVPTFGITAVFVNVPVIPEIVN